MAIKTGTHTIQDLAGNEFADELVMPNNVDALNEAIQRDLEIHNQITEQVISELAEITTERSTVYGTSAEGEATRKDEFTAGPTQKISVGSKVEFPLDGFQFAVGWTADYLRRATVQDMARKTIAARNAHIRNIQTVAKEALFGATNYTYYDRLVDGNDLAVKRLVNADSAAIPNGPNGETFDASTHTHYDAIDWSAATDAAKAAAVAALLTDVIEHGHGTDMRLYINRAQETDVRAMTGFEPYPDPRIIYRASDTPGQTLDISRVNNRAIGIFESAEVWVKSWVPANYMFAYAAGDPRKPLRWRVSPLATERGMFIAGTVIVHPLQAQYMEWFHGAGAYTRTNGAALFLGSGTYTAPTF